MLEAFKQNLFSSLNVLLSQSAAYDTVVISGPPRSGTTWLAELLRELPKDYKLISEPLRLSTSVPARNAGLSWRTHIEPTGQRSEVKEYLEDVLHGRVGLGPAWHFRSERPSQKLLEHVTCQKLIVKFCRANRMLHWIGREFEVRGTVMIIRHPCATISSMLRMGRSWQPDYSPKRPHSTHFPDPIPTKIKNQYRHLLEGRSLWVEHLAIRWCLDYYFPFYEHSSGNYPWILTAYERLLTKGEEELERIVDALGGSVTEAMRSRLGIPADHASQSLDTTATHKQLAKWRQRLSTEQIDAILRIVDAFDMGFYTDALHPDYDHLDVFQRRKHRWSSSSTFSTERPDT
jgi:hypothetical protein